MLEFTALELCGQTKRATYSAESPKPESVNKGGDIVSKSNVLSHSCFVLLVCRPSTGLLRIELPCRILNTIVDQPDTIIPSNTIYPDSISSSNSGSVTKIADVKLWPCLPITKVVDCVLDGIESRVMFVREVKT